jgi:heme exporter protein C
MKRNALIISSFVVMMVALYLVFIYAPTEKTMGIVQRLFYIMVPVAWLAMLAYVVTAVGSILFLTKKNEKWDTMARASGEIGLVFTLLTCTTGATWAKPVWGVWWDWGTPRLTTSLILLFIYVAYFLVRNLATEEYRGAVFASVVAIVGLADIPIIILSTSLWGGMHPPELIFQSGGLDPKMGMALGISITAYTLLYLALLALRISQRNDEATLRMIKEDGDQ